MRILDRKQDLPHPLTFRLVSPGSGNVVYAGIRQFTADEGDVGISSFLRRTLVLKDSASEDQKLTVHLEELPKGTFVKLRPLEAGYDADWKPLLERYMRTNFTTLTKGVILDVPSGDGREYRFLVDELKPEGSQAVCIVDTDLEVDIEALSEDQARETVKLNAQKKQNGGVIEFGQSLRGQVAEDGYVDYTLSTWDRSRDMTIELSSEGEVDLLFSPLSSRQQNRPREQEHVIAAIEGSPRRITLRSTNVELEHAEQLYISVHGWEAASFTLKLDMAQQPEASTSAKSLGEPGSDETICKNCLQSIPKRTLPLHESFCYRNNILCQHCHQVFQKSSSTWTSHWHCPHDSSHGNTPLSQTKHNKLSHMAQICHGCTQSFPSILSLAQHRTTTCPTKPILCQFCHLLVPQQGPDDPPLESAEVLLSGLTPHELTDGTRTTECHLCTKFIRLRDMQAHTRNHDLARKTQSTPLLCTNKNCSRITISDSLGLCKHCFAPLYASTTYDPDHKALKRRIERRYLTQFLTGCGQDWCRNEFCKTAREYFNLPAVGSKEGLAIVKDDVQKVGVANATVTTTNWEWRFCVDSETIQKRRTLGEMMAAQDDTYELGWWIAAFEATGSNSNDISKAKRWLTDWARRKDE